MTWIFLYVICRLCVKSYLCFAQHYLAAPVLDFLHSRPSSQRVLPFTLAESGRVYANITEIWPQMLFAFVKYIRLRLNIASASVAQETVGNTPCVKISDEICPKGRTIYAKLEFFNPLSSASRPKCQDVCGVPAQLQGRMSLVQIVGSWKHRLLARVNVR